MQRLANSTNQGPDAVQYPGWGTVYTSPADTPLQQYPMKATDTSQGLLSTTYSDDSHYRSNSHLGAT